MTDYPDSSSQPRAQAAGGVKRSGSSNRGRPLSGARASPSIEQASAGSEQKGSTLGSAGQIAAKNFKGPAHPFPSVDRLVADTRPDEWNNIPLPLVDCIKRILAVCLDLKRQSFENYNDIVANAHTANLIGPACSRDVKDSREESY